MTMLTPISWPVNYSIRCKSAALLQPLQTARKEPFSRSFLNCIRCIRLLHR
jgi:hypothetical protein